SRAGGGRGGLQAARAVLRRHLRRSAAARTPLGHRAARPAAWRIDSRGGGRHRAPPASLSAQLPRPRGRFVGAGAPGGGIAAGAGEIASGAAAVRPRAVVPDGREPSRIRRRRIRRRICAVCLERRAGSRLGRARDASRLPPRRPPGPAESLRSRCGTAARREPLRRPPCRADFGRGLAPRSGDAARGGQAPRPLPPSRQPASGVVRGRVSQRVIAADHRVAMRRQLRVAGATAVQQMSPRLLISLHDVTPAHADRLERAERLLASLGVQAVTYLFVPDFHGRSPAGARADFAAWGRRPRPVPISRWLPGYFHLEGVGAAGDLRVATPTEWFGRTFLTDGEAEFLLLRGGLLDERLRAGVDSFTRCLGRAPAGFVAPAWLYNEQLMP